MLYFILALITAIIIGIVLVIHHDMNNFTISEYEVHSDKLKKDAVFCLLSDLHEMRFGEGNIRLKEAIDEIAPDVILLSGDMLTAYQKPGHDHYDEIGDFIAELSSKYRVYSANGNHESKMDLLGGFRRKAYRDYEKKITKAGCTVLRNTGTYLEDLNMEIHGLEIAHFYFRKVHKRPMAEGYIEDYFGKPCAARFQLLIAHNPIYFEDYARWGADLTVSGHVHGGIVRLPLLGGVISPALVPFPKYDAGLFEIGDSKMILSRGLSTHSIRVRFNNPGDLCVIRLKADKKSNENEDA